MAQTMTSPKLRQLRRTQIQSIAKREFVRAVGKTEDIIRRLVTKHPKGVPIPGNPEGSEPPTPTPKKRNVLRKTRKPKSPPGDIPEENEEQEDFVAVNDEPQAGPSNEVPLSIVVEERGGKFVFVLAGLSKDASVIPPGEVPAPPSTEPLVVPSGQTPPGPSTKSPAKLASDPIAPEAGPSTAPPEEPNSNAEIDEVWSVCSGDARADGGPNEDMLVDCLREYTKMVDSVPTIEERLAESQRLLDRSAATLDRATTDLRELCMTRELLEVSLMGKMKKKKELWDGTAKMPKPARKLRTEKLRAERKAAAMKRWAEAKKQCDQLGIIHDPYEIYGSESEGEIIESLQTTPCGSRCGSPEREREGVAEAIESVQTTPNGSRCRSLKRGREEAVADDSPRKRSRS